MTISKNFQTLQNGLHIYTAGVALQEFFIFCFLFLVYQFQRRLSRECTRERVLEARKLLYVMYISLGLISVCSCIALCRNFPANHVQFRILFRIIEFSAGAGTKLTHEFRVHEVYQYVFDAMPMFFALVAMNVLHPGKVLVGKDSEFKGRKERKMETCEKQSGGSSDGVILG
jgi:peptidoglycan/LPS O-acetylase OafA/YrhL